MKNIIKFIETNIKSVKYNDRIISMNLNDLILQKFGISLSVYRGFFGEPKIDSNLLTADKCISLDSSIEKKYKACADIVSNFGFRIYISKASNGDYVKVQMVPSGKIMDYLSSRSLGKQYQFQNELYKSLV